jgi:hypothetical protein
MYREIEAREIQRELEHLKARIDAIKLDAMGRIYVKK